MDFYHTELLNHLKKPVDCLDGDVCRIMDLWELESVLTPLKVIHESFVLPKHQANSEFNVNGGVSALEAASPSGSGVSLNSRAVSVHSSGENDGNGSSETGEGSTTNTTGRTGPTPSNPVQNWRSEYTQAFGMRILAEIRAVSRHKQTLAHFAAVRPAAKGGSCAVMRFLHALGVDCNLADMYGQTPLYYACREGNLETVAFLIGECGADPSRIDNNGQTALYYAAKTDGGQQGTRDDVVMANKLCENIKNGVGGVEKAGQRNSRIPPKNIQKKFHKQKMEMRKSNDGNKRPHHRNRLDIIKLLVGMGCDPNRVDPAGRKAINYALDPDAIKILHNLMSKNNTTKNGISPASSNGSINSSSTSRSSSNSMSSRIPMKKSSTNMSNSLGTTSEEKYQEMIEIVGQHLANLLRDSEIHPVLFMSSPAEHYVGQYLVQYSNAGDGEELAKLETEFIYDHQQIINQIQGSKNDTCPWSTVCKSVGLNQDRQQRETIIKNIAGRRDKAACTLKVVHFEPCPIPTTINGIPFINGMNEMQTIPLIKWYQFRTVGYLYQKSKWGKVKENLGGAPLKDISIYDTDKDNCPTVEISHLKVSSYHGQRGVAVMLYCGLVQHLINNKMIPLIADMRLSVFDSNDRATRLYEKLGFQECGDVWWSELVGWPNNNTMQDTNNSTTGSSNGLTGSGNTNRMLKDNRDAEDEDLLKKNKEKHAMDEEDVPRSIAWRRYRRLEPVFDPQEVIAKFRKLIPLKSFKKTSSKGKDREKDSKGHEKDVSETAATSSGTVASSPQDADSFTQSTASSKAGSKSTSRKRHENDSESENASTTKKRRKKA